MLVTCPKCKTTYKISDELVQGATPSFRCSRCRHTFELKAQQTSEEPSAAIPPTEEQAHRAAENHELTFAFPPQHEEMEAVKEDDKKPLAGKSAQQSAGLAQSKDHPANRWRISDSEPKDEDALSFSGTGTAAEVNKVDPSRAQSRRPVFEAASGEHETSDNILSLDPYRDHQASTVPYLTLFGLLVIFYALATVFNYSHPSAIESVVGKVPLIGSSVLKNTHLKDRVALQSLQATYQSIQGNREVFVITGVALNQNPITIREVRVTGQIYNQEGKEIEQQTVWVGNAISAKIVRGMTAQDISDLQRLKPLKTFDIPPGDSVPFTIVFLKPAKGIKDFSCGVVAAEGEAA
jgi:predicted Zn finger-like uncharacterized protein